jgi:carboxypeptidase T
VLRRGTLATAIAALTLAAPAAAQQPGYHSYDELAAELEAAAAAHPTLVSRFSIGRSYEGRELWAVKISDNVAVDEPEPEVLFTAGQHAREHATVEMALYLVRELTAKYAVDPRIRAVVDSREIWIVPNLNPDGSEYDTAGGMVRSWRKNRQPNPPSSAIGTDLNRNWGFRWGCCRGSSGSAASEIFRGVAPFSAPETAALRDFVNSRAGQIRASIDFHAFSEMVLWPYGHTRSATGPGLGPDASRTFKALGTSMAATNGYLPQQASGLYATDGTLDDWLWGAHHIFAFTFELYPRTSSPGFYPPAAVLPRETARNREAVLLLLELADCPYRAIGREARHCGTTAAAAFADDFSRPRGWAIDPDGADTARAGRFRRSAQALRTARGGRPGTVARGSTSARSPAISLRAPGNYALTFRYDFRIDPGAASSDFLRVRVIGDSTRTVFKLAGDDFGRSGGWATAVASLNAFAGQTVRIQFEVADRGAASNVRAAIDDVRVTRLP